MQTKIRPCREEFFLKINKHAGQIPMHLQDEINMQGDFFLENNKCARPKQGRVGGNFFSKLTNVHACLFGTLQLATFQCGRYNIFKEEIILPFEKFRKPPSKVAKKNLNCFSFLTTLRCLNCPNRRLHVSKCGLQTNCIKNRDFPQCQ